MLKKNLKNLSLDQEKQPSGVRNSAQSITPLLSATCCEAADLQFKAPSCWLPIFRETVAIHSNSCVMFILVHLLLHIDHVMVFPPNRSSGYWKRDRQLNEPNRAPWCFWKAKRQESKAQNSKSKTNPKGLALRLFFKPAQKQKKTLPSVTVGMLLWLRKAEYFTKSPSTKQAAVTRGWDPKRPEKEGPKLNHHQKSNQKAY